MPIKGYEYITEMSFPKKKKTKKYVTIITINTIYVEIHRFYYVNIL